MTAHPGRRLLSFITAVAWRSYTDQCLIRAAALAYASLLSIVPLLSPHPACRGLFTGA